MTQAGTSHVLVGLSDGRAIKARRVVCCLGPSGRFRIPSWAMPFRSSSPLLHDASPHTPSRGRGSGGTANPMDDNDGEEDEGDGGVGMEGRILHSHELPRYACLLEKRRGHILTDRASIAWKKERRACTS